MIRRSTGTMHFFTEGMTLEFAVATMPHKCCGCLAIRNKPCEKAGNRCPWHANCLIHPPWLSPRPLSLGFISAVVRARLFRSEFEEIITLSTEHGFQRCVCKWLSCKDGFCRTG